MVDDKDEDKDNQQRDRSQQREQAREASKAHGYLQNTWNLFCMFLSSDKPEVALEKATSAMIVWKEFEEANYIEFPESMIEYEPPPPFDFAKAMREVLPDMAKAIAKGRNLNTEEEMLRLDREGVIIEDAGIIHQEAP